jgi:DNA repair exonuclease SbcCD nuclease subunit
MGATDTLYIFGDIFHTPKASREVVGMFLEVFSPVANRVFIMPGNHDLRYGNDDEDTSYTIINKVFQTMPQFVQYGTNEVTKEGESSVLGVHTLLFRVAEDVPYGVQKYETAESLAAKYPEHYLIGVGDMHKPFYWTNGTTSIVNCGSMTVQSINEAEYDHGYWVVDEEGYANFAPFEDVCKIVDDAYITHEKERDDRITSFVEMLKQSETITLDFTENVKKELTQSVVDDKVTQVIMNWLTTGGTNE